MKTRAEWLRGTSRLVGDGMLGTLDAVEGMHRTIVEGVAAFVPFGGAITRATGFAYDRVRDVARLAHRTADGAITLLAHEASATMTGGAAEPSRLAWLSALNGAVGDHLEASGNPLAIDMRLCRDGREVDLASDHGAAASDTLILFVHGLGMNDLQWRHATSGSFGARLEAEGFGIAAWLRYNSGLRIAANGRELSQRLQALHERRAFARIVLVGHSMGGLVCRAACADARHRAQPWADALEQVICLGTPHLGAPLERCGDSLAGLLAATPWTRPLAPLVSARSAGVKDLRDGCMDDIDDLPFAGRVRWRFAAATLSARDTGKRGRWIGDGLVPVPSALGVHDEARGTAPLRADDRHVFTRMGHMDLLVDARVLERLREWLAPPPF